MTTLEKVARSIEQSEIDALGCAVTDPAFPRRVHLKYMTSARAAIEALRTPGVENTERIFNAMLDWILREEV